MRLRGRWVPIAAGMGGVLVVYALWELFRWPAGHRVLIGDAFFYPVGVAAVVTAIADSGDCKALIHTLVQLGKTLGLETLGEGIEEPVQLHQLQREHCDSGQGFLFARPLEPNAIDELLNLSSPRPVDTRS